MTPDELTRMREVADLRAFVAKLDAEDWPNYAPRDPEFPAGHYRAILALLKAHEALVEAAKALAKKWTERADECADGPYEDGRAYAYDTAAADLVSALNLTPQDTSK